MPMGLLFVVLCTIGVEAQTAKSRSCKRSDAESLLLLQHRTSNPSACGVVNFTFPPGFPLGNAFAVYWNARAVALFTDKEFRASGSNDVVLKHLPSLVKCRRSLKNRRQLYKALADIPEHCLDCPYPAEAQYAPWHLIMDEILDDSEVVVKAVQAQVPDFSIPGNDTAIMHVRCDEYIMQHHMDYGMTPHRFIADNLPSTISKLIILGTPAALNEANLCGKGVGDLKMFLKDKRPALDVQLSSGGSSLHDWVMLATAPIVFCQLSTYCWSAALGNPNTVFMAVNGNHTAVVKPGSKLDTQKAKAAMRPGWSWVETDYMPGKAMAQMPWKKFRDYLRSDSCANDVGCLSVQIEAS